MSEPDTIRHHLRLSEDHYRAGRWDDSISNSRKVLEAVLQQVAVAHSSLGSSGLKADTLERPVRVRDYLESAGLLDKKEKEAIASTYALLSDTGGHPHIAQQDQARLMRIPPDGNKPEPTGISAGNSPVSLSADGANLVFSQNTREGGQLYVIDNLTSLWKTAAQK